MTRSNARLPRCAPRRGSRSSPGPAPRRRRPGRKCWRWGRRWRHRLPRHSARAASSRHGMRLSIGCVGSYAAPPANQIVHEAELVLFVGCDTGDQVTHTWRIPAIDTQVRADRHRSAGAGPILPNTLGLMGDPKATLAKLIAALGKPQRDTAFADRAAGIVAAWRAVPRAAARAERRADPRRTGCAPRSPRPCRRTAFWWPTPAIPASGPAR